MTPEEQQYHIDQKLRRLIIVKRELQHVDSRLPRELRFGGPNPLLVKRDELIKEKQSLETQIMLDLKRKVQGEDDE